ncbi:hypothetical protein LCGC14_2055340, partial [marine sediment metagenome]
MSTALTTFEQGDYSDPNVQRLFFGEEPQDEIDWIETLLTIPSEKGGMVVDFHLYPQQIQMSHNKTGRDITIKGRQTRASSFILAKNLRRMVGPHSMTCLTMTHGDQITETFRARIEHHLKDLKQKGFDFPHRSSKDELVFTETGARYLWGSGNELTAGRAYSAGIVHLSEYAHWPNERAKALLGGILPSVPGPPVGWLDIESTPSGSEGEFHKLVQGSKLHDPMSSWSTHFYPWHIEPRYRAGTTSDCDRTFSPETWTRMLREFRPTKDEEKLMVEAELDVGQIIWRRIIKKEQDRTDAPFLQEYVETLEGCFLLKGGNYFSTNEGINHLEQYQDTVCPPKEIVHEVSGSSVSFSGDGLHVWQRPQAGRPYAIWVDCAGGGLDEGADYSAINVLDCSSMFIAARLCLKLAPQEIAPMAVAIARHYNNALLGGERDAFGSVCVNTIQEIGYKNLWYWIEPGASMDIKKSVEAPWGHPTQIRSHILSSLRKQVFAGLFRTSDSWGVQQMGAFTWLKVAQKRDGLKAVGKGQKDDIVMCYAGLCYIAPLTGARAMAPPKEYGESRPIEPGETV